MENNLQEFEGILELKALSFLSEVDKNAHSSVTQSLLKDILEIVFNKSLNVLKIEATGNVGIALYIMLKQNLIESKHKRMLAVILSYYLLTNHIHVTYHEKHPLLFINRAMLMFEYKKAFCNIYKNIEGTNTYLPLSSETTDYEIHKIILSDIYPYKEYNEFVKSFFSRIMSELNNKPDLSNINNSDEFIVKSHIKLKERIKEMVIELVPLLPNH